MPGALDTRPPYLVWFGPAELESQLAQGTLTLVAVTSRDSRALLDGAEKILGRTATDPASTPGAARWCCAGWKPTSPHCPPPTARHLSGPYTINSAPPAPPDPSPTSFAVERDDPTTAGRG